MLVWYIHKWWDGGGAYTINPRLICGQDRGQGCARARELDSGGGGRILVSVMGILRNEAMPTEPRKDLDPPAHRSHLSESTGCAPPENPFATLFQPQGLAPAGQTGERKNAPPSPEPPHLMPPPVPQSDPRSSRPPRPRVEWEG